MNKFLLAILCAFSSLLSHADLLDTIKARGTLVAGVRADIPPFGQRNKNGTISGYDVDFAGAIARKLGVKLVVQDLDPNERISSVKTGKIDVLVATFTKTAEREREVNCSYGYFVAAQKVLAGKGKFPSPESLANASIGAMRGTTGLDLVRKQYPKATVVVFDDIPEAVRSLENGKIDAVVDDEPALVRPLSKMTNKAQFELSNYANAIEVYALAIKLGEKRFMDLINEALLEMENNGEAERIFNQWFGPQTLTPFPRTFRIGG
ncbi:transporter substrate-binding domain-containing protein [Iodobacter ciconiae]|uniref:Transporter substrate-binding domain-containing protein n=1 Tax=Iodobacter ciconiae TaxID=2496266 RepID=A0A3S8ZVF6_9NEIS|nr:transporter substrate-binding domain-containing protein [Iodobacter ciconiae]AZN37428.1 transporter substrate-binding domain-containing protein [Iodobacter ciconiae]